MLQQSGKWWDIFAKIQTMFRKAAIDVLDPLPAEKYLFLLSSHFLYSNK
jgi:hypothetical protein